MKKLLEDYKNRLKTANEMIERLRYKDDANPDYIKLKAKANCYHNIIFELKGLLDKKT